MKWLLCLIVGLGVGFWTGYTFSAPQQTQENTSIVSESTSMSVTNHASSTPHPMLEVESRPIPRISINAHKDAKDGYNIRISTAEFKWAPDAVNTTPAQGEGHAHIYVNGIKLARVYGEWFHVSDDKLQKGENLIEVTLNANDHSEWTVSGQHIADSIVVIK